MGKRDWRMRGIDKTTSREALIVLHCLAIGSERELRRLSLIIKKDLDVLDILKENIFVADNMIYASPKKLNDDDYNKLKEWMNNDK